MISYYLLNLRFLFAVIFFSCAIPSIAHSKEIDNRTAFVKDISGVKDLPSGLGDSSLSLQFKLHLFSRESTDKPSNERQGIRLICETNQTESAILLLSNAGLPLAYIGDSATFIVDRNHSQTLLHYPGVRFQLSCSHPGKFFNIKFDKKALHSTCQLDLFQWSHSLLGLECDVSYVKTTQTYCFKHPSEALFCVSFNENKSALDTPVVSLDLEDRNGKGYTVSNILCKKEIPNSILGMENLFFKKFAGKKSAQANFHRIVTILPFNQPYEIAAFFETPQATDTSKTLQCLLFPPLKKAANEIKQLELGK